MPSTLYWSPQVPLRQEAMNLAQGFEWIKKEEGSTSFVGCQALIVNAKLFLPPSYRSPIIGYWVNAELSRALSRTPTIRQIRP